MTALGANRLFMLAAALVAWLPVTQSGGSEVSFGFEKNGAAWRVMKKTGKPDFEFHPGDGAPTVLFKCDKSSFSLNRPVTIDPKQFQRLRWSWRAETLPTNGDLRDAKRNDQVLQVLLKFSGGRTLSYVWDTTAPVGTTSDESVTFLGLGVEIKVMVLESGGKRLNEWIAVERNVREDFQKLFGQAPGTLEGLRVQTNCQYTKSTARGSIGTLTFQR